MQRSADDKRAQPEAKLLPSERRLDMSLDKQGLVPSVQVQNVKVGCKQ